MAGRKRGAIKKKIVFFMRANRENSIMENHNETCFNHRKALKLNYWQRQDKKDTIGLRAILKQNCNRMENVTVVLSQN